MNPEAVIVNGGYLIRSASVSGSTLSLQADFNTTTSLEIIGVPKGVSKLKVNGQSLKYTTTSLGDWMSEPEITIPTLQVPDLSKLTWYTVDSLPEVKSQYADAKWPTADKPPTQAPMSPVSLHGSDYGFNTGTLIFRAHFTANGKESQFRVWTTGGTAYASSVWLNDRYVGSFKGDANTDNTNSTYTLPNLTAEKQYVLTIVVDQMGFNENFNPGDDEMKVPRGIFDYSISAPDGTETNVTSWKITGNLGGEEYADKFRGPLNEGGLFFERQGYHFPSPPVDSFSKGSPYQGSDSAGISYYTARLPLSYPSDKYDIPLSFAFDNGTSYGDYRAMLFVNGFQFGKYINNIGPQAEFPVPEGILNYNGDNWIGLSIWALDNTGAKVPGFSLKAGTPVQSSRKPVALVNGPSYKKRADAY